MLYFCPSAKVVTLSFAPSSWTSQAKQVLWSFRSTIPNQNEFYLELCSLIRNSELRSKLLPLGKSKLKQALFAFPLAYS